MNEILIFGAGNIGKLVSVLLASTDDYHVHLVDIQRPQDLPRVPNNPISFQTLDINDDAAVDASVMANSISTVVSCLPFQLTVRVAELAARYQLNYFDLTEDVQSTSSVLKLAAKATTTFVPQCGLAPGFISIVANHLMQGFDAINSVKMRVGALPLNVSNPLNYALNWSTQGLVNEYIKPCPAIVNGKHVLVPAMEGLEEIKLDGLTYEAFHTSGGIGTLVETFMNTVRNMDYKTIRYPGHCEKMKFLLQGLKLNENADLLCKIMENAVPQTELDVVLVYSSVLGRKNGQLVEKNYAKKFYPATVCDHQWTAIQMTTASSLCVLIDLVTTGAVIKPSGILRQEDVKLHDDFLANRLGKYFAN